MTVTVSWKVSSPVVHVEQRSLLNNSSMESPNREESQEERIHVDQEAVEDINSEDGGKMESKAGADHHEEDAGDDGVYPPLSAPMCTPGHNYQQECSHPRHNHIPHK